MNETKNEMLKEVKKIVEETKRTDIENIFYEVFEKRLGFYDYVENNINEVTNKIEKYI